VSDPSLLRFDDVACRRGGRSLFEGLSFALAPGEALIVTGPNGVGKSSLLRLAAGLLSAEAGRVECLGPVALADDAAALDERLTLDRALAFWARLDGRNAAAAIDALGLGAIGEIPVRMLSTGQRKRATLARVVASGAPLWLLDEPANGLDGEAQNLLAIAIADHRTRGGAVLAASHQPLPIEAAATLELSPS
jgi:heme exporter protein A